MNIVILDDYQDAVRKLHCASRLDPYSAKVYTNTVKGQGQLAVRLKDADIIVLVRERTQITRQLVEKLPRLKLIAQTGKIGSHIDVAACTERGIAVAEGVGSPVAPAELTWALVMAATRRLPQYIANLKHGAWQQSGLKAAYTYLQALDPNKQRFALMVADGEISKTCAGEVYKEALGLVKGAHDMGIPTYVVGIDVDPMVSADLQSLATAGGKLNPNNPQGFYETTSQIELQAALQQIVDDTLSCVIDVDPEPAEPELFEVWIGKNQVAAAADCAKESGWVWTKPHAQIELCGQACSDFQMTGMIDIQYRCPNSG
mgnify:CR=1 FL=1